MKTKTHEKRKKDGGYAALADYIMSAPVRRVVAPLTPITLYPVDGDRDEWIQHYREAFPPPDYEVFSIGKHVGVVALKGLPDGYALKLARLLQKL